MLPKQCQIGGIMLHRNRMSHYFEALNRELKKKNVVGEIGICGGAVMCLVYKSRMSTKDVDAILLKPSTEIRDASKNVAKKYALDENWVNDAAKGFVEGVPPTEEVFSLSHLKIWAPSPDTCLQ